MTHLFPCEETRKEKLTEIIKAETKCMETITEYFKGEHNNNLRVGYQYLESSRHYLGMYLQYLRKNGTKNV